MNVLFFIIYIIIGVLVSSWVHAYGEKKGFNKHTEDTVLFIAMMLVISLWPFLLLLIGFFALSTYFKDRIK